MPVGSGPEEGSLPGLWRTIFLLNPHMAERASSGLSLSFCPIRAIMHFPGGSDSKEFTCNAGDLGSIPGLGKSSGEGNGNPLQYSCLGNFMDRGAWWAIVDRVAKSQTRLSNQHFHTHGLHFLSSWSP